MVPDAETTSSDAARAASPHDGPVNGDERSALGADNRLASYVEGRINAASVGTEPFRHLYIENIFPEKFYADLRAHMLAAKYGGALQDRQQDSRSFTNKRFSLVGCRDDIVATFRSTFLDRSVMRSALSKFYLSTAELLSDELTIHEEFEYFFTKAGKFQDIHVDIPPKFLSFVFYIPETPMADAAKERENATILYDRDLRAHQPALFRANSVCIFAPHFHSYHGFHSTEDRDVLVMFYIDPGELARWRALRQTAESAPFTRVPDFLDDKLQRHPLIEFGTDPDRLRRERAACRINAPQGRVFV